LIGKENQVVCTSAILLGVELDCYFIQEQVPNILLKQCFVLELILLQKDFETNHY
jgi:hypothetical protein